MAADLTNPSTASESTVEESSARTNRAVKTFAFDATAGRKAQPADADLPLPTAPRPKYLDYLPFANLFRQAVEEPQPQSDSNDDELATLPVAIELNNEQEHPWRVTSVTEPRQRSPRGKSAWWMSSLALHVAVIILLGFSTLAVMKQPEELDLYSSAVAPIEIEELADLAITPTEEPLTDFQESGVASYEELSGEILLEEVSFDGPELAEEAASLTDFSSNSLGGSSEFDHLFGADGVGLADIGSGAGAATVSFFGTEVKAKRILYMLDNSGGMRHGGKFEALVSELRKSVNELDAEQQFYVIFYSDMVYPLYYPNSSQQFVSASDNNRRQLQRWLDSVEFCVGNAIDEALSATAVIQPDVVFLLTDGDLFTTDKKRAMLLDRGQRPYPIYTFGLGVSKNSKTAAGLLQVAEVNGGTFQAVKVSKADQNLADQKQRPYHNKEPGAVWGKNVGTRKW